MTDAPPRRPPPMDLAVLETRPIGGDFVSITFGGAELESFIWPGPASHLKVFPPNAEQPVSLDPAETPRRTSRTYTPRRFDHAQQALELHFLLHGEGPASSWASAAQVGEQVSVGRARATYAPPDGTQSLLLFGDDSAIPAIGTILDAFPALAATVVIESVSSSEDRPPLSGEGLSHLTWVDADLEAPGSRLEAAVRDLERPESDQAIWVGCEALAVRRIRRFYLEEVGFPLEFLVTRGYWRLGESNHPDHDRGE